MTAIHRASPSGSLQPHHWSPTAVICAFLGVLVAGFVISVLSVNTSLDRISAYLVIPLIYLGTSIYLARGWYRITCSKLGIPGQNPLGDVALSIILAGGYLFISLALAGLPLAVLVTNLSKGWQVSKLQFVGRLLFFPISEELFFRGVAFQVLVRRYDTYRAILVTSFMFAAGHLSLQDMPYLFVLGLVLGWSVQRPGTSLFAPIIFHMTYNLRYLMSG